MRTYLLAAGLFVSALLPATANAAGSGVVTFGFVQFYGPIANIAAADIGADPWFNQGRFNGVLATPDGSFIPSAGNPDFGLARGSVNFAPGTQTVAWRYDWVAPGAAGENLLSFVPATFSNVAVGESFRLGTLTYQNGFWHGGGSTPAQNVPSFFSFNLGTISPDGAQYNQSTSGFITNVVNQVDLPFDYVSTNPTAQLAEADWIYLTQQGNAPLGSLRVYDSCCRPGGFSSVGSIELWGRFGSLELVELRNPQGGVFTSGIGPLDPGTPGGPPGVPEPASWAMLIAGFGLTGAAMRRRRRGLAAA
jgi:hypothetical protein